MTEQATLAIDGERFSAVLHPDRSPQTVKAILARLPFESRIVHVRWSGEAVWVPLGDMDFGVGFEDATCHPAPGQMILYPGGISETELLLAYGGVSFASKAGPLAGNHFLSVTEKLDRIAELGRKTLWEGALDISISR
ncbi:DUF3830 family protein [Pseudoroseicyclus sp. CXY001]|uniref:DUF3830 family protein n=1 Tax=Pseudoroseicyclus sp. CXY001 TaxID=3242492 RepID=UPI003570B2AC